MDEILLKCKSLSLYRSVVKDDAIKSYLKACGAQTKEKFVLYYARFISVLIERDTNLSFTSALKKLILKCENAYTIACASGQKISDNLLALARREIAILTELNLSVAALLLKVAELSHIHLPMCVFQKIDLNMHEIALYHKNNGYGTFTQALAYKYNAAQNCLEPIYDASNILLKDLKDYKEEKQEIIANTLAFLQGKRANHVLLYGDRGTGKSSTVHAILNEYSHQGLRLIEISKEDLKHFNKLIALLALAHLKFIIFLDDLTFNEDEDNYGVFKAALEGGLTKSGNTLIYATSNRRHLIKEYNSDRKGDDMHVSDTIEEQLSLSDRFGIIITFIAPSKQEFMGILQQILADRGIAFTQDIAMRAEQYALKKGGRSPRAAVQFANLIEAQKDLKITKD